MDGTAFYSFIRVGWRRKGARQAMTPIERPVCQQVGQPCVGDHDGTTPTDRILAVRRNRFWASSPKNGGSSRFVVSCYPAQGSMRMRVPARLRGNFWGDAHPPGRTGVQHPGAGAEDDRLDLTSRFVLVFLSDSDPGAVGQKPILNLDT